MPLYCVDITREQHATVYVEADTEEEAREGGPELVDSHEWDDLDTDVIVSTASTKFMPWRYWTGGPEGHWVDGTDPARSGRNEEP